MAPHRPTGSLAMGSLTTASVSMYGIAVCSEYSTYPLLFLVPFLICWGSHRVEQKCLAGGEPYISVYAVWTPALTPTRLN